MYEPESTAASYRSDLSEEDTTQSAGRGGAVVVGVLDSQLEGSGLEPQSMQCGGAQGKMLNHPLN